MEVGWYDYGARFYDPQIGRWHVIDPMVENGHHNYTPYAYVYNNPLLFVDPFGLDSTYFDSNGQAMYSCGTDPNSNSYFVIRTTQTTEEMYQESPNSPEKGNTNPISKEAAEKTRSEISNGNVVGEHMSNVVEIPNPTAGKNVLKTIGDDGKGGTKPENNTEYATNVNTGTNETYATVKGEVGKLTSGFSTISVPSRSHHSHPSGTKGNRAWQQAPSRTDISGSPAANDGYNFYVWGMRSGQVYIYNQSGVVATVPIKIYE